MKWMQRPGRLLKKLEGVSHPGVRLKIIREGKNHTSEFKGSFGYRDLCDYLVKSGVLPDTADGRKLISGIEDGFKDITREPQLIEPWLKFLDVSKDDVMLRSEPANQKDEQVHTQPKSERILRPEKATNEITIHNHCEGLNIEIFFEQDMSDGSITVRVFNDEPVPEAFCVKKSGFRQGKAWVPQPVFKYANSSKPEDRKVIERKVLVKLE